jgi:NADPH:quinone reductase-like Zn-dependent oxidoreductase
VGRAGEGWQKRDSHPLPLTLSSHLSGVIEESGAEVADFQKGSEIFGVTNSQFTGGYAEWAVADAAMIAPKPTRLTDVEAASVPVVASTAWQMVFDHGQVDRTKRVLVQGAAGNVGAYAVQLARQVGAEVIGTGHARSIDYIRELGANEAIDVESRAFEKSLRGVDVVIDTVSADTLDRSLHVLKRGGILVSSVTQPDLEKMERCGVRGIFFLVKVTSAGLRRIAGLLDTGKLRTNVGEVLELREARLAHEMLSGKPHKPNKIVLSV